MRLCRAPEACATMSDCNRVERLGIRAFWRDDGAPTGAGTYPAIVKGPRAPRGVFVERRARPCLPSLRA
eukprot:7137953-Pyramimonas_sp.AAC.1